MMNAARYKAVSDRWADYLVNQPETGMGYWVVSVTLIDGRRYDRMVINGGLVTQVYGMDEIPFDPADIVAMEVTHDKWKFKH